MSNLVSHTVSPQQFAGSARSPAPGPPLFKDMVWIPGGTFLMGSDHGDECLHLGLADG
jgi:hypothetical protein